MSVCLSVCLSGGYLFRLGDRTLIVAGPLSRLLLLLRRSSAAAAPTKLLSSSCLLELQQHLEEGRDTQNDEMTL